MYYYIFKEEERYFRDLNFNKLINYLLIKIKILNILYF